MKMNEAVAAFPQVFGTKVRQQRESVRMPVPMSREMLSQMLGNVGVPLSANELAALEAGAYPNIDVRLMLALAFLLEFSVDAVLVACLQKGAATKWSKGRQ